MLLQYDLFHMQLMEGNSRSPSSGCCRASATCRSPTCRARNEPGTGEINFEFLLAPHRPRWATSGWIGCEYNPAGDTREGLKWARRLPVVEALREFLPERAILHEEEDTRPYECDGLTAYRQLPMVVALPETEEQVQRILKTCSAMEVPVVPRGAGTGLSGGALPPGDGVLLSMAKFKRMLRIDPLARVAVVQPGVRNAVVSELAAPLRPVLRARSVEPDRLHHRRQRRRRTPAACIA